MATLYLKTAGGNWSAAATWSNVNAGGGDNSGPPTAGDNVIMELLSGNVTIDAGAVCRGLDQTSGTGNYAGTMTHTAAVTLTIGDGTAAAGNFALRLAAGATYTLGNASTSAIAFVSTSATQQTITTNGKTIGGNTFSGAGSSYILGDALTSSGTFTLTAGTFDTGNLSIQTSSLVTSGATTRVLTLGSSTWTTTSTNTSVTISSNSGLTLNAGTSTIVFNATASNPTWGSASWYNLVSNGAGIVGGGTPICVNLTRTGTATKTCALNFSGNPTITGAFTVTGNSAVNRVQILSTIVGIARTITAATVSLTNVDFMDITAAGAASPFTGTSIGNCLGNTNITFDSPVNRYAVVAGNFSNTATWSTTSGGSGGASVPLPQDDVFLDANSAAGTYTCDMPRYAMDFDCTGFTRTLNFTTSQAWSVYGNFTLSSGMTYTAGTNADVNFRGRGTHTITTAGKTVGANSFTTFFVAPGGTYTLQDSFTTNQKISVLNGTFVSGSFNISCTVFATTGTATRSVTLGTSTVTFTLTSVATVWNSTSTGLTLSAANSTLVISGGSANAKTFTGSGLTYGALTYTVNGSTGALIIQGSNTFNLGINFSDATNARTLRFTSGTTTTIGATGSFNVNGTAGKLMTIESVTSGSFHSINKAGDLVSCDYLSIQDSHADGAALWYAGANSTNVSGNTGWIFTAPPQPMMRRWGGSIWPTGARRIGRGW